ncbi:MAG: hypothetical protein IKC09_08785 [Oscillospiraceae bacterium]|nr:hypothetical protein [Oscillospiraceae bacterium]
MKIERAIQILDPTHREHYESIDPVNEACRMGMEALKEKKAAMDNPGQVSDGYHTFDELYHHRAVLFSVICHQFPELAWKSLQHDDPNEPMYDGMFIVGIDTPEGQATYHYDVDPYWDMFRVKELDRAPKWDGHTADEAIRRIASLGWGMSV